MNGAVLRVLFGDRNQEMFFRKYTFDFFAEKFFQFRQLVRVFFIREVNGDTAGSGTASATDAMNILFHIERQVVIDDMRYRFDMDPARCNIRSDKHAYVPLAKSF